MFLIVFIYTYGIYISYIPLSKLIINFPNGKLKIYITNKFE